MKNVKIVCVVVAVIMLLGLVLGSACAGAKGVQGPQGEEGLEGPQGPAGEEGDKGDKGDAGAQGAQGVQGLQGLQGIQGPRGLPGIGVEWVGEWDSSVLYAKYDAVGYQGSSYVSRQESNTNHLPTDTNWWDLMVVKGDTGSTGAPGADGEDGAPGPNMIVAMGSIAANGSIVEGYNVNSCVWNDTEEGWYEITLDVYYTSVYVTLVTPFWSYRIFPAYGAREGKLVVILYDDYTSSYLQSPFSFMVLDATP